MRPVASNDPAYLGVDLGDVVEALLDLLAEHLKFIRIERTAVQEFHWNSLAPPRGWRHGMQSGEHWHRCRRPWTPGAPRAEHKAADRRQRNDGRACGYRSPGLFGNRATTRRARMFRG